MKIIEMEEMNDHFDFDFADAVVVRESVGDIKVGSVKIGKENEADVKAECTSDGKLTLNFTIPKCRDGATFTPSVSKDGVLSWSNDKSLINPAPVSLGVSETHSSGSMAFEIKAVNGNKLTLSGTTGIKVGYTYSMQIGNNYNAWGTITAVSGNTVTVSNMPTDYNWNTDTVKFLSFPDHPELGTFKIGEGAYSFGLNNKANMIGAFAVGSNNISDGKNSFTSGAENFAGYRDAAFGQNNKANGLCNFVTGDSNTSHNGSRNTAIFGALNQTNAKNTLVAGEYNWSTADNSIVSGSQNNNYGSESFLGGEQCTTLKKRSLAHGKGLYTNKEDQAVFGAYNEVSTDDLFQVGMGTADNARKNAFVVRSDGRATVASQPVSDNDVATKKYVDAKKISYNDLTNKPTIPTQESVGEQISSYNQSGGAVTYTAQSMPDNAKAVARANIGAGTSNFSGNYNDLTNKPTLITEENVSSAIDSYNRSGGAVTYTAQSMNDNAKATARANIGAGTSNFSGNYNDLTNKPTIPTQESVSEQISSYNQSGGAVTYTAQSMNDNAKATARANIGAGTSSFSGSYNDLTNKPTLFSGSYTDLTNKPTILTQENVSEQISSYNQSGGAVTYTSQSMNDNAKATARKNIGAGTSSFSGNYNDLTNKPTILTEENVSSAIDSYNRSGGAVTYTSQSMNDNAKAVARANIGALGSTTEVYYNEGGLLTGKSTSFTLADYSWLCFAYIGDNGIDTKFFPRTLISKQSTNTIAFTTTNGIYQIKSTGVTATQANAETKGTLIGIYGIKN